MTEAAAIPNAQSEAPRRGLALHPWRWFFLIALLPTVVVALPGSLVATSQINTDGFALLAALLIVRAGDRGALLPAVTMRRLTLFAAALAALLAVAWWEHDGVDGLVLPLFTVAVTATALSCAFARTPALRQLVRPLLQVRASWPAWLIAILAWPLLGALGVLLSRLGEPMQIFGGGSPVLEASFVFGSVASAIPAALAWYGFAARRLLALRSALVTALLVGLVPWLAIVLPMSVWSGPVNELVLGFSHPLDSYVVRSSLGALAVGIVAVWVYQRSRGSLLPVLVLLGETTIVSWAVFIWSGPRWALSDNFSWLMVGLHCLLALALVVQGRMWQREGGGA